VDGTDFSIFEPSPFDPKWFSHKINGPGLRYEVAICIQTGWIVWIHGPFPCGAWPDLRIARDALIFEVLPGEMLLADGGYRDNHQFFETPTGLNNNDQQMKALARARHETCNRRFKEYGALSRKFRHPREKHGIIFTAVANITQLAIMLDQPLFSIQYRDI
jgi:hypothetical protein